MSNRAARSNAYPRSGPAPTRLLARPERRRDAGTRAWQQFAGKVRGWRRYQRTRNSPICAWRPLAGVCAYAFFLSCCFANFSSSSAVASPQVSTATQRKNAVCAAREGFFDTRSCGTCWCWL